MNAATAQAILKSLGLSDVLNQANQIGLVFNELAGRVRQLERSVDRCELMLGAICNRLEISVEPTQEQMALIEAASAEHIRRLEGPAAA